MNPTADAPHITRWQHQVAADPGCPAFVPLAEVYRREGRVEVARRLCIRGLERSPGEVEGHVLLGRILRDGGDLDGARDQWEAAIGLDPEHRVARRALGYLCLERRDWPAAVRHLEHAAASDPADDRLRSALALARRHLQPGGAEGDGGAGEPPADPADRLVEPVADFVRETQVAGVVVLDDAGRILLRQGRTERVDLASLATLAAGVHAASRALARMLGEPRFRQLYQGEGAGRLLIGSLPTAGGALLLVALLGEAATLGLVRVRFDELATRLAGLDWIPAAARAADAQGHEERLTAGLVAEVLQQGAGS